MTLKSSISYVNTLTSSVTNDSMCAEIKQIPIIEEELEYNKDKTDILGVRTHWKSAIRDLDTQKFNLKLCENVTLYPGGTVAYVQAPTSSLYFKEWYISPSQNKILLNTSCMIMEGVYKPEKDGPCKVNIVNCSEKKVKLQKGIKVAQGFKSIKPKEEKNVNDTIGTLSSTDLLKRIQFIKEKLRLDENAMMKDDPKLKSKVINLCMDYYEIFSQNDFDIGNTTLLDFDIELKEGAKPTKSRVIPLNPTQEKALKDQLDTWLSSGVISEGISEWSTS